MPALLADVQRIVVDGTVDGVSAFNQAQVTDEQLKVQLFARSPDLERAMFHLEDHSVLRGCVAAFDLDEALFEQRARTFHLLFADAASLASLTGALLTNGDYSRPLNHRMSQFGSGSNLGAWRDLLTGAGRSHLAATRGVLGCFLDTVAAADGGLRSALGTIERSWLDATIEADGLGWRWYFVKYSVMREGRSGIYVGSNGALGYGICMLDKSQMNSWYRDPYLSAINRESGVEKLGPDGPWFTGYETEPRWLHLERSGAELQCVDEGLLLRPPSAPAYGEAFTRVCMQHGVNADGLLKVPQVERDGQKLDTCDRVQVGAALVRDLVKAGL